MATLTSTSKNPSTTIDIYKKLPPLKTSQNQRLQFSTVDPFTPKFVTSHVTLASNPEEMYTSRVQGRSIMLDNPARESRFKKEMAEKKERTQALKDKKKLGRIGKREAKEKGVWKLDPAQARFELFLPLHHLWMGYMSELLGLSPPPLLSTPPSAQAMPSSSGMHPKLVKADFNGSFLTVRRSKNPCLIGLAGIVIHETENSFRVITEKNAFKMIPKQSNVFAFAVPLYSTIPATHETKDGLPIPSPETATGTVLQAPHIEFELYGNQFCFRSADRTGRKFKHKETIEL